MSDTQNILVRIFLKKGCFQERISSPLILQNCNLFRHHPITHIPRSVAKLESEPCRFDGVIAHDEQGAQRYTQTTPNVERLLIRCERVDVIAVQLHEALIGYEEAVFIGVGCSNVALMVFVVNGYFNGIVILNYRIVRYVFKCNSGHIRYFVFLTAVKHGHAS